jgi:carboxyl-terminal processing protease
LLKTFYTRNNRPVKEGKGIFPDVEVELPDAAAITGGLIRNDHLFNYATQYFYAHETIAEPNEFRITDEVYQDFVSYLSGKKYDYETASEKLLIKLEKAAENEKYSDRFKDEFDSMKKEFENGQKMDLELHKDEIIDLLENEIVSRYYYQNGRIVNSLAKDIRIAKAIEILNDSEQYKALLASPK